MPTYDWNCQKCDKPFEVIRGIKEYRPKEKCPSCKRFSSERIFSANVQFIGTKVEDREFNHGLGIITKSAKHRKDEARARGLEEVGTEAPSKMHAKFDQDRAEKIKRRWDEV